MDNVEGRGFGKPSRASGVHDGVAFFLGVIANYAIPKGSRNCQTNGFDSV
jgi:hypothetical protein